jgi:hypothetical protein
MPASLASLGFGSKGNAKSDLIQPASHGLSFADGTGLASQGKERRLARIFHVLLIAKHTPADPAHHTLVPPHQKLEGGLIALSNDAVQEFNVADAVEGLPPNQLTQVSDGQGDRTVCHGHSRKKQSVSTILDA